MDLPRFRQAPGPRAAPGPETRSATDPGTRGRRRNAARAAVDVLYGFFVITSPAGVITYQRPPFRFRACPDAVPEAESPT
jgi:hypothetical protein